MRQISIMTDWCGSEIVVYGKQEAVFEFLYEGMLPTFYNESFRVSVKGSGLADLLAVQPSSKEDRMFSMAAIQNRPLVLSAEGACQRHADSKDFVVGVLIEEARKKGAADLMAKLKELLPPEESVPDFDEAAIRANPREAAGELARQACLELFDVPGGV